MDIAEMDQSRWVSNLPQLKNVIRPSFATEPVADVEPEPFEGFQDAVTGARPGLRLDQVGDRLVPLAGCCPPWRSWKGRTRTSPPGSDTTD